MSAVNRQQFLAELAKLLTFMYEEDRLYALGMYERMFDIAEDDEQGLIQHLMSPTRQAVIIARAYNAKERKLSVDAQWKEDDGVEEDADTPAFVLAINKIFDDLFPDDAEKPEPVDDQFTFFELDMTGEAPKKPKMPKAAVLLNDTQEFQAITDADLAGDEAEQEPERAFEAETAMEAAEPEQGAFGDTAQDTGSEPETPADEVPEESSSTEQNAPKKLTLGGLLGGFRKRKNQKDEQAETSDETSAAEQQTEAPESEPVEEPESVEQLESVEQPEPVEEPKSVEQSEPMEEPEPSSDEHVMTVDEIMQEQHQAEEAEAAEEIEVPEEDPVAPVEPETVDRETELRQKLHLPTAEEKAKNVPAPEMERTLVPEPEPEEEPAEDTEEEPVIKKPAKRKLQNTVAPAKRVRNTPLFILFLIVAIPVTLLLVVLLLIPALLCLGLACGFIALGAVLIISAFSGFAVLADILLLIGAAAVALALGLLALWIAVWLIGSVMVDLFNWEQSVCAAWCYKEVPAE